MYICDTLVGIRFQGVLIEKRVTDITVPEFISYGPQKELGKVIINVDLFVFVLIIFVSVGVL